MYPKKFRSWISLKTKPQKYQHFAPPFSVELSFAANCCFCCPCPIRCCHSSCACSACMASCCARSGQICAKFEDFLWILLQQFAMNSRNQAVLTHKHWNFAGFFWIGFSIFSVHSTAASHCSPETNKVLLAISSQQNVKAWSLLFFRLFIMKNAL